MKSAQLNKTMRATAGCTIRLLLKSIPQENKISMASEVMRDLEV
jgi:hypothetical protein